MRKTPHLQPAGRQVSQEGGAVEQHKLAGVDLHDNGGQTANRSIAAWCSEVQALDRLIAARPSVAAGRIADRFLHEGTPRSRGTQPCLACVACVFQPTQAVEEEHGVGHVWRNLHG